jgi:uncharacterized protein YndB with AHSA1/START domain
MWKKTLLGLVVAVAALAAFVASRPDRYRVERSAVLAAPPERAYARVADFHAWEAWSPWARLDPAMKTTFGGVAGAAGATYEWSGNDKVGRGRMTIREASPPARLAILLQFFEPFASEADTTFTFAPEGAGTRVTWAMEGQASFVAKAMCLVKSMDAMIGPDFEKGLAAMRQVVEPVEAR